MIERLGLVLAFPQKSCRRPDRMARAPQLANVVTQRGNQESSPTPSHSSDAQWVSTVSQPHRNNIKHKAVEILIIRLSIQLLRGTSCTAGPDIPISLRRRIRRLLQPPPEQPKEECRRGRGDHCTTSVTHQLPLDTRVTCLRRVKKSQVNTAWQGNIPHWRYFLGCSLPRHAPLSRASVTQRNLARVAEFVLRTFTED
jgi:hypothetical protein